MTASCAHTQLLSDILYILYLGIIFCVFLPLATSADSVNASPFPTGSENLIWWVQVSDVHVSVFNPSRIRDLEDFFIPAMQLIQPSAILITGDLTGERDAHNGYCTIHVPSPPFHDTRIHGGC